MYCTRVRLTTIEQCKSIARASQGKRHHKEVAFKTTTMLLSWRLLLLSNTSSGRSDSCSYGASHAKSHQHGTRLSNHLPRRPTSRATKDPIRVPTPNSKSYQRSHASAEDPNQQRPPNPIMTTKLVLRRDSLSYVAKMKACVNLCN